MTAMAAAFAAVGVTTSAAGENSQPETPKKNDRNLIDVSNKKSTGAKKGHWGKSGRPNMIEWMHPDLGSVQIELKQFLFGKVINQQGPNTWCRIDLVQHKPKEITLDINYSLNEDVELLHARSKRVIDTAKDDPEPFVIAVEWTPGLKKDSEMIPTLPGGYGQDFQLFFINKKTGFLVHLDVAVVSRNGVFWVTVQEVTGAQIVWHPTNMDIEGLTSVKIGERAYTLVPVYNENCYKGFDPVASWSRTYEARAEKVLSYAVEFDAAIPVEDCAPGEWKPEWPSEIPAELVSKGYKKAVVTWFNLTLGYGFFQLEDDQVCFVHFKAIQDENGAYVAQSGDFPVLEPSKGYYIKWILKADKTGEKKPAATAVRPV